MPNAKIIEEMQDVVRSVEIAREAVLNDEWGNAQRQLKVGLDRVGILLRDVGEKTHEVMMAPKVDRADRE